MISYGEEWNTQSKGGTFRVKALGVGSLAK